MAMEKKKGELKHRGKKAKARSKSNDASSTSKAPKIEKEKISNNQENDNDDDKSLREVFLEHPLIVVLPWFAIPYGLYLLYFYLHLERPDLLEPFGIHLRPAVRVEDPRQVLIVGSMSSGTVQVQDDLSRLLQLEIGHETCNSQDEFVRDGTVSWIHVMRYLEPPKTKEAHITAHENLCGKSFTAQMGLHPMMYRPSENGCSTRQKWSQCWSRECSQIIRREWGCALPSTPQTCQTPFRKVLHQVRHPLRTIESLVVKFCQGGLSGTVSPSFSKFVQALFPGRHYSPDYSCIEAAANYVLAYNQAMLVARTELFLVDGMFQVETSSPCDIARLAGLLQQPLEDGEEEGAQSTVNNAHVGDVVYPPNAAKVALICSSNPQAQAVMKSTKNKVNVGLVSLDWEDLQGGKHGSVREEGDRSLEMEVRLLVEQLGYKE